MRTHCMYAILTACGYLTERRQGARRPSLPLPLPLCADSNCCSPWFAPSGFWKLLPGHVGLTGPWRRAVCGGREEAERGAQLPRGSALSPDGSQPDPNTPSKRSGTAAIPRADGPGSSVGRLREDGDFVWDDQQVSAGRGLQPGLLRGPDSGASGGAGLLGSALVPGIPGFGIGGNSVHHHHLHPEVMIRVELLGPPVQTGFMLTAGRSQMFCGASLVDV